MLGGDGHRGGEWGGGGGEEESGEKMKKAIGVEREVMQQKKLETDGQELL